MLRRFILSTLFLLSLSTAAFAGDAPAQQNIGIVDFAKCVTDSKPGKQEQSSFEALKNQMTTLLQDTEKQLNDISSKFNDPEYLDGLSPEAEEELKVKFRTLSEEMNRYQNQYYQVLNQANMRVVQTLSTMINTASENVAKEKRLNVVLNKEACFFFNDKLDVTPFVIAEMDKAYEVEMKKQGSAATTASADAKK